MATLDLVLGRKSRVNDDVTPFEANVLANRQIFEDACHHLT